MRFAALNKEASSSSILSTPSGKKGRPTLEAQESACLELYHSAIRLQQEGQFTQVKDIYRQILESEVMEEVGGASQSSTLSKLKYLVYKNIATIAREQGDLSAAVDAYIEASTIDTSDVSMWCQLASAALSLGNLLLARKALEYAVQCNGGHWPALESLCTVLFALGDYHSCLMIIKRGLDLDSSYPRGLVYLHHISERCPEMISSELALLRLHLMKPIPSCREVFLSEALKLQEKRRSLQGVVVLPEDIMPTKKITALTLYSLANCLLSLYKQCKELSQTKASYAVKIDTATLLDVTVESTSSPAKKLVSAQGGIPAHVGGSPIQVEVGGAGGSGEEGGGKKEAKRRLLEELEPFAPKRRSTRVKSKGTTPALQQEQSHFEMLSKFIPSWLAMTDLPELSELSPLKKPKDDTKRGRVEERKMELSAFFDSVQLLNEVEVVSDFVKRSEDNFGILDLLRRFVLYLSLRYDQKWSSAPFPVVKLYTELYKCLHPHLTLPSPYCTIEDAQQPSFSNMAMIALCYIEAYIDTVATTTKKSRKGGLVDSFSIVVPTPPKCFVECFNFVKHCAGLVGACEKERVVFALRTVWCHAKWAVLNSVHSKATSLLQQIEKMLQAHADVLQDLKAVYLPNLKDGQLISQDHVRDKIKQLEQCVSINEIHELYNSLEYSVVVNKLLPLFEEVPEPPIELLIGRERAPTEEKSSLTLLLSSLLHLHHYHSCLQMALQAALTLHAHGSHGNERWAAALKEAFVTIDKCLPSVLELDNAEQRACVTERKGAKDGQTVNVIVGQCVQSGDKEPSSSDKEFQSNAKGDDETMPCSSSCGEKALQNSETDTMDTDKDKPATSNGTVCTREDLLHKCDLQVLKKMVACVLKTMDLVTDMADSPVLYCLPVAILWKVLYTIVASKWEAAAEVDELPLLDENPLTPANTLTTQPSPAKVTTVSETVMETAVSEPMDTATCTSSTTQPNVGTEPMDTTELSTVADQPSHPVLDTQPMDTTTHESITDQLNVSTSSADISSTEATSVAQSLTITSSTDTFPVITLGGKSSTHISGITMSSSTHSKTVTTTASSDACTLPSNSTHSGAAMSTTASDTFPVVTLGSRARSPSVDESSTQSSTDGEGSQLPFIDSDSAQGISSIPGSAATTTPTIQSPLTVSDVVTPVQTTPTTPINTHHIPSSTRIPSPPTSLTRSIPIKSPVGSTDGQELPLLLKFLVEAHGHLGRMGWCCKESGCFLKMSVDILRSELKQLLKLPTKHRETLLVELEQCFYCLYGHPQKRAKARELVEHNSPQVPLTWESAQMLIEYFHPSPLPSIDDSKSPQVTAELLSLYKRIVGVLPNYGKVITLTDLNGLIGGTCTESMLVKLAPHQQTTTIAEVYYLLADDALKSGYNHNAIQHYQQNLCYCPERFDSWAGLALARSRKIVERLNIRDVKLGMERYVQKQTAPTVRCYKKAVTLNDKHCYVMEKFGFFCYTIQSFSSQILLQPELFLLKDVHQWAADSLNEMLSLAHDCFTQALSLEGSKHSEPWLYQLMLGKIGRKQSRPFRDTLEMFLESLECLHQDGAIHPEFVELTAKYHALEVIEVYYQLHTYILKSLLQAANKQKEGESREELSAIEACIKDCHSRLEALPLGCASYPGVWEWVCGLVDEAVESSDMAKDTRKEPCIDVPEKSTSKDSSSETLNKGTDKDPQMPTLAKAEHSAIDPNISQPTCDKPSSMDLDNPSLPAGGGSTTNNMLKELLANESGSSHVPGFSSAEKADQVEDMDTSTPSCSTAVSTTASLGKEDTGIDSSKDSKVAPIQCTSNTSESAGISHTEPTTDKSQQKKLWRGIDPDLLKRSLYGVAVCAVRCPAYFKPLYRIAAVCFELSLVRVSKEILLGPVPNALLDQQEKLLPLFVLKPNMFSNMWQIPSEEINRPGNFSTHARRNLDLLLKVLLSLQDLHSLSYLAQHLKNKPDSTKQYMRDNERGLLFKKAARYAVQVITKTVSKVPEFSQDELSSLLTVATSVKPIVSKADSTQKLTKEINTAISVLKAAIVPPPSPSKEKTNDANSSKPNDATKSLSDNVPKKSSTGTIDPTDKGSSTTVAVDSSRKESCVSTLDKEPKIEATNIQQSALAVSTETIQDTTSKASVLANIQSTIAQPQEISKDQIDQASMQSGLLSANTKGPEPMEQSHSSTEGILHVGTPASEPVTAEPVLSGSETIKQHDVIDMYSNN